MSRSLPNAIDNRIAEIKIFEHIVPAVLIVHSFPDFKVEYISERGLNILQITSEDVRQLGSDYNMRFFNPEDAADYIPKIASLLERNDKNEIVTFFQQVRASRDMPWSWYLSSIKIILWDEGGCPLLTLTMAVPIDPKHHITSKIERLLADNNFLRQHHHEFSALTRREREILRLLALGESTCSIAKQLHISENTASTHRKNVKKKLNLQSNYDVARFAQAFDLI